MVHSDDFRSAGARMKQLGSEFKNAGFAGKDQNQRLWDEFSQARSAFYDRRNQYYECLNIEARDNAAQRRRIISELQSLLGVEDFREAGQRVKTLHSEWKSVGFAGRVEKALDRPFKMAQHGGRKTMWMRSGIWSRPSGTKSRRYGTQMRTMKKCAPRGAAGYCRRSRTSASRRQNSGSGSNVRSWTSYIDAYPACAIASSALSKTPPDRYLHWSQAGVKLCPR